MCLIIANPECKPVPHSYIANAYKHNADGFGVMFANGGSLKIARGVLSFDRIVGAFQSLTAAGVPYVAHFRFATHGTKGDENCHPFQVSEASLGGIGMVHNGTLAGKEWQSNSKSDTALFVERIQKHIAAGEVAPEDLFEEDIPGLCVAYNNAIGHDKLVFMNGKGEINIYNSQNGLWKEGVWYSNQYSLLSRAEFYSMVTRRGKWKARERFTVTV